MIGTIIKTLDGHEGIVIEDSPKEYKGMSLVSPKGGVIIDTKGYSNTGGRLGETIRWVSKSQIA